MFVIIYEYFILKKIYLLTIKFNNTEIKCKLMNDLTVNNPYNVLATYEFPNNINCDDFNIVIYRTC